MLNRLKEFCRHVTVRYTPFHRNPIEVLPNEHNLEVQAAVLSNPHLGIDNIIRILRQNADVNDAIRVMNGSYLLQAVVTQESVSEGYLHVNAYRLHSERRSADHTYVCAGDWKSTGLYQYFLEVDGRAFTVKASIKAIKDDRRYALSYANDDPSHSWVVELGPEEMALLGFNIHH